MGTINGRRGSGSAHLSRDEPQVWAGIRGWGRDQEGLDRQGERMVRARNKEAFVGLIVVVLLLAVRMGT